LGFFEPLWLAVLLAVIVNLGTAQKVSEMEHVCEVRPHKDHRSVDLISDALLSGRLWYDEPNPISDTIGYATFYSRSHR
jgi:hypothetical protein